MKKIYQEIEITMVNFDTQDVLLQSDSSDGVAGDLDWLTSNDTLSTGGAK